MNQCLKLPYRSPNRRRISAALPILELTAREHGVFTPSVGEPESNLVNKWSLVMVTLSICDGAICFLYYFLYLIFSDKSRKMF